MAFTHSPAWWPMSHLQLSIYQTASSKALHIITAGSLGKGTIDLGAVSTLTDSEGVG